MSVVQFVGEDRRALRRDPEFSVSVEKLRRAFLWLSMNSLPFMDATKHRELSDTDLLDKSLEELLTSYVRSVGTLTGGVPSELVQGASRIPPGSASVVLRGPADRTEEGAEADEHPGDMQNLAESGINCAAALGGGVDEVTNVQLWDSVLRKYKVAQT